MNTMKLIHHKNSKILQRVTQSI